MTAMCWADFLRPLRGGMKRGGLIHGPSLVRLRLTRSTRGNFPPLLRSEDTLGRIALMRTWLALVHWVLCANGVRVRRAAPTGARVSSMGFQPHECVAPTTPSPGRGDRADGPRSTSAVAEQACHVTRLGCHAPRPWAVGMPKTSSVTHSVESRAQVRACARRGQPESIAFADMPTQASDMAPAKTVIAASNLRIPAAPELND